MSTLKNTPKVTKQEVQDYLETNRLQLIEDERIAGAGRLTERDLNALPKEFDWLDRYRPRRTVRGQGALTQPLDGHP
jgi:hypothetical protein